MKLVLVILLILVIYIVSFIYMYKYVQKTYSNGGCFYGLDIGLDEILFTVTPILNTIIMLYELSERYFSKQGIYNKFFNIKK